MTFIGPPLHFPADPPIPTLLDGPSIEDTIESAAETLVSINNQLTNESFEDELVILNETVNNALQTIQSYTAGPDAIIISPSAPNPSVNTTTTIQVLHDLSDIDGSFSTENDENATYIQTTTTTTIEYMEAFDINSIAEYTPPLSFSTQSSTIDYQPASEFTGFLLPSSINPEQVVDPPHQPIESATQQHAADAQPYPTTIQLMDPNSQEMNTSVEWMQLGDQPVDGAGPTYGAMVLLEDEGAAPEEVFTFLPY
ncbi:hypothetical protein TNCV_2846641 [Trichonephila clavipes]|nr:hypothetical protein TNCV_2846641 [Trichonephila clavipes]